MNIFVAIQKEISGILMGWLCRVLDLMQGGALANRVRGRLLSLMTGCQFGRNVKVSTNVYIHSLNEPLSVGDESYINTGVHLDCTHPIHIGKRCLIGFKTSLITASHVIDTDFKGCRLNKGDFGSAITIEDDVWIGANTIILPGVTIGRGSVIAAGSIVSKSIPANVIAIGAPARAKREINHA